MPAPIDRDDSDRDDRAVDEIVAPRPLGRVRGRRHRDRDRRRDLLRVLLLRLPAAGRRAVSTAAPRRRPATGFAAIAIAAERRWAWVVVAIIALLVVMMVFTGLHWAAMPPSRVETVDVKTLHLKGEFVESNLGTSVGADGKVTVRLIAQQYSFEPQCIVVPADMPVTFRGTSTDTIHGFVVGRTNANTMLIPASSRRSRRRSRSPASS